MEAHIVLGHISPEKVKSAVRDNYFTGFDVDLSTPITDCEVCLTAKAKRSPIAKHHKDPRAEKPGEFIHADVWGPSQIEAKGGFRYFSLYTDDRSRMKALYLQKSKDETFERYTTYESHLKTQFGIDIKLLHSDRGGEFTSNAFAKHLNAKGTKASYTTHDTPEMNGVSERGNYTIIDHVRALLVDSGLPKSLWGYAAKYVVWLTNRLPTRPLEKERKSPFEVLHGTKPDLSRARQFGCRVFVKRDVKPPKLDARAIEGNWIGPSYDSVDGHLVYWKDSGRITVERNVAFLDGFMEAGEDLTEKAPMITVDLGLQPESTGQDSTSKASTLPEPVTEILPGDPVEGLEDPIDKPRGRGLRDRKPSRYVETFSKDALPKEKLPKGLQLPTAKMAVAMAAKPSGVVIPQNLAEAMRSAEWPKWKEAMDLEQSKLEQNHTFKPVPKWEATSVPIPLQWVYDVKLNEEGNIIRYKARLVARGDRQERFVNYNETYSPVMKSASRNILLALAAENGWTVRQGDFENAYLNGVLWDENSDSAPAADLKDPIYVGNIPGYEHENQPGWIYILLRGLYGLKQAGRIWYHDIADFLLSLGFKRCLSDPAIFYLHDGQHRIFVGIHVDDPLIVATHREDALELESAIQSKYVYKVKGDLSHFLGATYKRDWEKGTISANQGIYIDALVQQCGLGDANPVANPMLQGVSIGPENCPISDEERRDMQNIPYREVLGLMNYIATHTRPDISYPASMLGQVTNNPGRTHWEAMKRVARYLKGTRDLWMTWGRDGTGLRSFVDASHASKDLLWKSMTGYIFLIAGGAVSWCAKKQELVALSTAESEYIAMTHAAKELIWIRTFIGEILRPFTKLSILQCDNQAAIALANDNAFHARTKHIALRYHFIRETIENQVITPRWIASEENIADLFTKPLSPTHTGNLVNKLGLV